MMLNSFFPFGFMWFSLNLDISIYWIVVVWSLDELQPSYNFFHYCTFEFIYLCIENMGCHDLSCWFIDKDDESAWMFIDDITGWDPSSFHAGNDFLWWDGFKCDLCMFDIDVFSFDVVGFDLNVFRCVDFVDWGFEYDLLGFVFDLSACSFFDVDFNSNWTTRVFFSSLMLSLTWSVYWDFYVVLNRWFQMWFLLFGFKWFMRGFILNMVWYNHFDIFYILYRTTNMNFRVSSFYYNSDLWNKAYDPVVYVYIENFGLEQQGFVESVILENNFSWGSFLYDVDFFDLNHLCSSRWFDNHYSLWNSGSFINFILVEFSSVTVWSSLSSYTDGCFYFGHFFSCLRYNLMDSPEYSLWCSRVCFFEDWFFICVLFLCLLIWVFWLDPIQMFSGFSSFMFNAYCSNKFSLYSWSLCSFVSFLFLFDLFLNIVFCVSFCFSFFSSLGSYVVLFYFLFWYNFFNVFFASLFFGLFFSFIWFVYFFYTNRACFNVNIKFFFLCFGLFFIVVFLFVFFFSFFFGNILPFSLNQNLWPFFWFMNLSYNSSSYNSFSYVNYPNIPKNVNGNGLSVLNELKRRVSFSNVNNVFLRWSDLLESSLCRMNFYVTAIDNDAYHFNLNSLYSMLERVDFDDILPGEDDEDESSWWLERNNYFFHNLNPSWFSIFFAEDQSDEVLFIEIMKSLWCNETLFCGATSWHSSDHNSTVEWVWINDNYGF